MQDDVILQLKTQVRKLQETLQKKDKDVSALSLVASSALVLSVITHLVRTALYDEMLLFL